MQFVLADSLGRFGFSFVAAGHSIWGRSSAFSALSTSLSNSAALLRSDSGKSEVAVLQSTSLVLSVDHRQAVDSVFEPNEEQSRRAEYIRPTALPLWIRTSGDVRRFAYPMCREKVGSERTLATKACRLTEYRKRSAEAHQIVCAQSWERR